MMPRTLPNGLSLTAVRDLRVARVPVTAEDLAALETDVLARAAAGLSDGTIASDVLHLEQVHAWFGRPLWEGSGNSRVIYYSLAERGHRVSAPSARWRCCIQAVASS